MRAHSRLLLRFSSGGSSAATASAAAGSSTKTTNVPTHYETLEVDTGATQSEIKSAYFKLSKQYHPDKNSSEAATVKFRDIAEAYEVLGNYASRRTYDRSILTRTRYHVPQATGEKPRDPKIQYYQSQAALFRQNPATGSVPSYDFDAWTKAHYGTTLKKNLRYKANAINKRSMRDNEDPYIKGNDLPLYLFALILVTAVMVLGGISEKNHDQALTIRQRNELDRINEPEKQLKEFPATDISLQSESSRDR